MLSRDRMKHSEAMTKPVYVWAGKSKAAGRKQYRFHCGLCRLTEWVLYRTEAAFVKDPESHTPQGMWTGRHV